MAQRKSQRNTKRGKRKGRAKRKPQRRKVIRAPSVLEFRNPALMGFIRIELPPGWKKKEFPKLTPGPAKKS